MAEHPLPPISDLYTQWDAMREPYLRTISILDKGHVRLVDWCGSDHRIVQAARVSYGTGTKSVREDKGLIDYLARNAHTSPFEMCNATFHCKMPIFTARQVIRHRTAAVNEISGRYSVMQDEFYVPNVARMQRQSADNKQGSSLELIENPDLWIARLEEQCRAAYADYEQMIGEGCARELARVNLPLSLYTEWYWSINLHNLFHFLRLRLDTHAQFEVREVAQAKYDLIKPIFPYACEAFEEHILGSTALGKTEAAIIMSILPDDWREKTLEEIQRLGWVTKTGAPNGRAREFLSKLERIASRD